MTTTENDQNAESSAVGTDRLRDLLDSMRLDEQRGAVWELQQCIERCTAMFASADSLELSAEFESIKARAVDAYDFEAKHGVRSLFQHGHPFNQMLDQSGLIDLKSFPTPSEASRTFWAAYFGRAEVAA